METPRRIGRYEIERLLGSGAMGQVWLARDPDLDRAIAVKTVRDHGLPRETLDVFLTRFRNEARAAARLHHPSIVAVYDVGEDPDAGPYLVLEYVKGTSLKSLLHERGPLPPDQTIALATEVGRALDTAHAAGVIHRDIKPDNLLVTPEGKTKLADFGVARLPDAVLTREGQFLGTPCYAAPETLSGGDYGPHTDLFSFAAVLYEAVSGVRAFPGDDAVSVAHKVIHDTPPKPSSVAKPGARVPPPVDDVIMRALSKEPRDRPKSAGELAKELRAAFHASGAIRLPRRADDSHGGGSIPPPRTESRGSAWLFVAVIALGLVAAVALVVVMGGGGPDAGVADAGAPTAADAGALAAADAGATPDASLDGAGSHGLPDGSTLLATSGDGADAGAAPPPVDAGRADGGAAHAVTPTDAELAAMTAGQREDAAKDAVARARRALASFDLGAARAALAEAQRYDPGNGDLEELAREIDLAPVHPPP